MRVSLRVVVDCTFRLAGGTVTAESLRLGLSEGMFGAVERQKGRWKLPFSGSG